MLTFFLNFEFLCQLSLLLNIWMPLITGFPDQICKDWSWLEFPFLFLLDNSSVDIVKPANFLQNVTSVT